MRTVCTGHRSWIAAGIVSGILLTVHGAAAQPPPASGAPAGAAAAPPSEKALAEAKAAYGKGMQLYDDGAFDAARVQFERAYNLAPSYKILYNTGLVYYKQNEFVGARAALKRYLAEGKDEVPPEKKQEAVTLIEKLDGLIAYATVTVNVPDAEVTVDDKVIGTSPLSEPVPLNPGRRKIGAKKQGRLPDAKVIEVASGDKEAVPLQLQEGQVHIIETRSRRVPWVGWGTTAALAIGAGVFGYLSINMSNKLEENRGKPNADPNTLSRESDVTRGYAITADVLALGAIVAGGLSLYYTIKWGNEASEKKEQGAPPPSAPTAKKEIRIMPGPMGGSFAMTF